MLTWPTARHLGTKNPDQAGGGGVGREVIDTTAPDRQSEPMSSLLPSEDEHLTTGWEADLDPADSLVRQAVDAHASWALHVARAGGRPWAERPGWVASHCRDSGALANLALVKIPPSDLAAVAAEVAAWYPAGIPHLLLCPFPAPAAVLAGYSLIGHPPLMVRPADTSSPSSPSASNADITVRRVDTPEELVDAERVMVEGYPIPELQPFQPGSVYDDAFLDDNTAVFVAYDDGGPLGTAAAHSAAGMTLVENVAALGAARGRGVGAAVTAAATVAFGSGQPAVLIASDDGQPVYQRLGYLRVERWTAWLRSPTKGS